VVPPAAPVREQVSMDDIVNRLDKLSISNAELCSLIES
jgi:hypothetical protein